MILELWIFMEIWYWCFNWWYTHSFIVE